MKHYLWLLFLLPLFSYGNVCPKWTEAQEEVLRASWEVGKEHDLGYTLMAIVIQESFVGSYIIRSNGSDGKHGSWGISHISLEFAMESLGVKSIWQAKQDIIPKLLTNDQESLRLSVMKLQQSKNLPWRQMVAKYNGVGQAAQLYAEKVANNVKMLQKCYKGDKTQ